MLLDASMVMPMSTTAAGYSNLNSLTFPKI